MGRRVDEQPGPVEYLRGARDATTRCGLVSQRPTPRVMSFLRRDDFAARPRFQLHFMRSAAIVQPVGRVHFVPHAPFVSLARTAAKCELECAAFSWRLASSQPTCSSDRASRAGLTPSPTCPPRARWLPQTRGCGRSGNQAGTPLVSPPRCVTDGGFFT
jgi:hypothetical protein